MADTDWNAFTDSTPQSGDKLVAARAGAGVNLDVGDLIVRDPSGLLYSGISGRAGVRIFNQGGVTEWFVGQESVISHSLKFQLLAAGIYTDHLTLDFSGNLFSGADNSGNALGLPGKRWSVVFSATGTINTSDERDKVWQGGLSEAEIRAGKRIIGELGFYQWKDAVAEKGDGARWHFGVRAQRAFAILEDEGLDWRRYAWCCYDEWPAEPAVKARNAKLDSEGNILEPAIPARAKVPAGNRYGIRPDQLALFLIAVQEARIAALEARL